MRVEYSSNNSGGGWWLSDDDWKALENAGWKVNWVRNQPEGPFHRNGEDRWLGGLARDATLYGATMREAIDSFELATAQSSAALGCNCCGPPHNFSFYGDHGETEYYSPDAPYEGHRYVD